MQLSVHPKFLCKEWELEAVYLAFAGFFIIGARIRLDRFGLVRDMEGWEEEEAAAMQFIKYITTFVLSLFFYICYPCNWATVKLTLSQGNV